MTVRKLRECVVRLRRDARLIVCAGHANLPAEGVHDVENITAHCPGPRHVGRHRVHFGAHRSVAPSLPYPERPLERRKKDLPFFLLAVIQLLAVAFPE